MAACSHCGQELIAINRKASVTLPGIIGAAMFALGLAGLVVNALVGIGLMLAGAIIGALGRGERLVLQCPGCQRTA